MFKKKIPLVGITVGSLVGTMDGKAVGSIKCTSYFRNIKVRHTKE